MSGLEQEILAVLDSHQPGYGGHGIAVVCTCGRDFSARHQLDRLRSVLGLPEPEPEISGPLPFTEEALQDVADQTADLLYNRLLTELTADEREQAYEAGQRILRTAAPHLNQLEDR